MRRLKGIGIVIVWACLMWEASAQSSSLPQFPALGYTQDAYPIVKPVRGTAILDRENDVVRVVAWGTCDVVENENDADCIASAYAVARAQGLRNLSEILGTLKINEDLNLKDIYKIDNEVVIRSNALLRQVRPVTGEASNGVKYRGYDYMPDTSIVAWVTLEMSIDGTEIGKGLDHPALRDKLEARLSERSRELQANPIQPDPVLAPLPIDEPAPPSEAEDYTGLIIDGSAFPISDVLIAPSVLGASGQRVYDLNQVTRRVRLSGQIIRPCPSLTKAKTYTDKVGANPMVLTALTVDKQDIILSDNDVTRLKAADVKNDFLRHGRVIVVY